jgi:hypothetical protein
MRLPQTAETRRGLLTAVARKRKHRPAPGAATADHPGRDGIIVVIRKNNRITSVHHAADEILRDLPARGAIPEGRTDHPAGMGLQGTTETPSVVVTTQILTGETTSEAGDKSRDRRNCRFRENYHRADAGGAT